MKTSYETFDEFVKDLRKGPLCYGCPSMAMVGIPLDITLFGQTYSEGDRVCVHPGQEGDMCVATFRCSSENSKLMILTCPITKESRELEAVLPKTLELE